MVRSIDIIKIEDTQYWTGKLSVDRIIVIIVTLYNEHCTLYILWEGTKYNILKQLLS